MGYIYTAILILLMAKPIISGKVRFELEPDFCNRELFNGFILSSSTANDPVTCAKICSSNPECSVFSHNSVTQVCTLYEYVVYPEDLSTAPSSSSTVYYIYRRDGCSLKNGFMHFRAVDLCVKLVRISPAGDKSTSQQVCANHGGSQIVTTDTIQKLQKIADLLVEFGLSDKLPYVGASLAGQFTWEDGGVVLDDLWNGPEPNGGVYEPCAVLDFGGLADFACNHESELVICEVPLV